MTQFFMVYLLQKYTKIYYKKLAHTIMEAGKYKFAALTRRLKCKDPQVETPES